MKVIKLFKLKTNMFISNLKKWVYDKTLDEKNEILDEKNYNSPPIKYGKDFWTEKPKDNKITIGEAVGIAPTGPIGPCGPP